MRRIVTSAVAALAYLTSACAALSWTHGGGVLADGQATAEAVNLGVYLQTVTKRTTGPRIVSGQYAGTAAPCYSVNAFAAAYPADIAALFSAVGIYPGIEGAGLNEFNCGGGAGNAKGLQSALSAGVTSLTVSAIGSFPSGADLPFLANIAADGTNPSETVTVSAVAGAVWTISTTLYAHALSAAILPESNSPADLSGIITQLVADGQAGSIITLYWLPNNPFTGGPFTDLNCNGGTLADLVNPATTAYAKWHSQIAYVAAALKQFQAARVPVIWRPMPEANAPLGYWYSSCMSYPTNAAQYAALWQDLFSQFTQTYSLHNLLWMFAVTGPTSTRFLEMYPGAQYVDIVGLDSYTDADSPTETVYQNWSVYSYLGKVVAYPERGPQTTNGTSTVFQGLIASITSNPHSTSNLVAFWSAWQGPFALVNNPGGTAVMSDPASANRADVKRVLACMSAATAIADKQSCALTN